MSDTTERTALLESAVTFGSGSSIKGTLNSLQQDMHAWCRGPMERRQW